MHPIDTEKRAEILASLRVLLQDRRLVAVMSAAALFLGYQAYTHSETTEQKGRPGVITTDISSESGSESALGFADTQTATPAELTEYFVLRHGSVPSQFIAHWIESVQTNKLPSSAEYTLPSDEVYFQFIETWLRPLAELGIDLQFFTRDGALYFASVQSEEEMRAIRAELSIPVTTKQLSRTKFLIGVAITDLSAETELRQWFETELDAAQSFAVGSHGSYYKTITGELSSTQPPPNQLETVIPLSAAYTEPREITLQRQTQPLAVQQLYSSGETIFVHVAESETSLPHYVDPYDGTHYVFVAEEQQVYPVRGFTVAQEQTSQGADNIAGLEPLRDAAGNLVYSRFTRQPVFIENGVIVEVQGEQQFKLGRVAVVKELGILGTYDENWNFSALKPTRSEHEAEHAADTAEEQFQRGIEALGTYVVDPLVQDHIVSNLTPEQSRAIERYTAELSDLQTVSPYLLLTILGVEDSGFFPHNDAELDGFRLAAYVRAVRTGGGGSTLQHQIARNSVLSQQEIVGNGIFDRVRRKWSDIGRATGVGEALDAEDILRLYVENLSQFGAVPLFGKSLAELNLAESLLAAGEEQAPGMYNAANITNVQSWLRRTLAIANLLNDKGLSTTDELVAAVTDAHQLLLPTPAETIPWLTTLLPALSPEQLAAVPTAIGNDYIADIRDAGHISEEQYQALISKYYSESIWRVKLSEPVERFQQTPISLTITEHAADFSTLRIHKVPYHLLQAENYLHVVKDSENKKMFSQSGNVLLWNSHTQQYYELDSQGNIRSSIYELVVDETTGAAITIQDFLPADAVSLVAGEYNRDDLRRGSDGMAYVKTAGREWLQIGSIIRHHTSGKDIVVDLTQSEKAELQLQQSSNGQLLAAWANALRLREFHSTGAAHTQELDLVAEINAHAFVENQDPNTGFIKSEGGGVFTYARGLEGAAKTIGRSATAYETTNDSIFISGLADAVTKGYYPVVYISTDGVATRSQVKNIADSDHIQLEVFPDAVQTVTVLDITTAETGEDATETYITYFFPRPESRTVSIENSIVTVTASEFLELTEPLNRNMALLPATFTFDGGIQSELYDYTDPKHQTRLVLRTNGFGVFGTEKQATGVAASVELDRFKVLDALTTLDTKFQAHVEQTAAELAKASQSAGAVVLLAEVDPTGSRASEVVVSASIDGNYTTARTNLATEWLTHPGSIMKPLTVLFSTVPVDQVLPAGGSVRVPVSFEPDAPLSQFSINNWTQAPRNAQPTMNSEQGIIYSNNPFMVNLSLEMMRRTGNMNWLVAAYTASSFASEGIIGVDHYSGAVFEQDDITIGGYLTQSFGQRVQFSAAEMLEVYTLLAAQGYEVPLTISKDQPGWRRQFLRNQLGETQFDLRVAAIVNALSQVPDFTDRGEFGRLEAQGIKLHMKTGTAETGGAAVNASMAGFAVFPDGRRVSFDISFPGVKGRINLSIYLTDLLLEYWEHVQSNGASTPELRPAKLLAAELESQVPASDQPGLPIISGVSFAAADYQGFSDIIRRQGETENQVLIGAAADALVAVELRNGVGYAQDAAGNRAFIVEDEGRYWIVADGAGVTVPGELQDRYPDMAALRAATTLPIDSSQQVN